MISTHLFGPWLDGSSMRIREILGDLKGVSKETLERIDHISRPTGDGPVPHHERDVMLYERLVLLALAENALAKQRASSAPKAKNAS